MDETQYIDFCAVLKKHFTKSTEGDVELCWKHCQQFDYAKVVAAIERHRMDAGKSAWRPSPQALVASLRTSSSAGKPQRHEKVAHWIRRESEIHRQFVGQTDDDAVFMHFCHAWAAVRSSNEADDYGKQAIRKMIRGHCRAALLEIGVAEREASEMASAAVDLKAGEPIIVPEILKSVPSASTNLPHEEIRKLAES